MASCFGGCAAATLGRDTFLDVMLVLRILSQSKSGGRAYGRTDRQIDIQTDEQQNYLIRILFSLKVTEP